MYSTTKISRFIAFIRNSIINLIHLFQNFLCRLPARLFRRFLHLIFCLLLLCTLYLTGGRLLMARLSDQTVAVEMLLSQMLGAPVTIGELKGGWFRFGPALQISNMRLIATENTQQHTINSAVLSLDPLRSLLAQKAVITKVSITGLDLTLLETSTNKWTLAGLAGVGPDYSRQLLDAVFDTKLVALSDSVIRIIPLNNVPVSLDALHINLVNSGNQHDMHLQARINGQQVPTQLTLAMEGNPTETFFASIYASITDLNMTQYLAAALPENWQLQAAHGSVNLWANFDSNGLQRLSGHLSDVTILAAEVEGTHKFDIQNASSTFALRPDFQSTAIDGDLLLRFEDLALDWQQTPWDIEHLQVSLPTTSSDPLRIQANEIDLSMLSNLAQTALPLPEVGANALRTLNPRGFLQNVVIETTLDGNYPGLFKLRGNLQDVAVDAWQGAPAGTGVQGFIQAQADSGFVELDSQDFTIKFPQLFAQSWHYDHINARVNWQLKERDLRVQSSIIDLENPFLRGRLQFDLYNTVNSRDRIESDLSLLVGMQSMDVATRSAYLPTMPDLKETMNWLDTALLAGQLSNNGFILRTSTLSGAPGAAKTSASWYNINNGQLKFLPDWPTLDAISGHVEVRDAQVDVSTTTAQISGIDLLPATATVRPLPVGGALLVVDGIAKSTTAVGLEFLRTTPVHTTIGDFLDNWQATGAVDVALNLNIPLGANQAADVVSINVVSTDSELQIKDYGLTFTDINGTVTYNSIDGLNATALDARLFDYPVTAGITTMADSGAGREIVISSQGRASTQALQQWPNQSGFVRTLLDFTPGAFDYNARLSIPANPLSDGTRSRLDIDTDLLGVMSLLPAPMEKSMGAARSMELSLAFADTTTTMTARYGDILSGEMVLDADGIQRGQLYFGDRNRNFTIRQADADAPGLLINGDLERFEYEEWESVADIFNQGLEGSRSMSDYLRLIDVNVGELFIFGTQFDTINMQIQRINSAWSIFGQNTLIAGNFTIPDDISLPWLVNLDYLRFPPRQELPVENTAATAESIAAEEDLLEAVNPANLPAMDFATAELSVGEYNLGAFSFVLNPNRGGANVSNFKMSAADAHITDLAETGGANIDWLYSAGKHTSSFNGLFAAGNLAEVLPAWGNDANVESESARFAGNLQWNGSPVAFSLAHASGQLQMDISNGGFVDIEAGSSKLFGALNFDSLIRRLQLDFSDLFQSGFAFDSISGNMNFTQGVVTTNDVINIEGTSSKITINGEINLAEQTIAADMQVRIPLGENISMLAGMLGAWPIALSTYIASKIFAKQVEDFTTIVYRLDGPWDNPEAGFVPPTDAAVTEVEPPLPALAAPTAPAVP